MSSSAGSSSTSNTESGPLGSQVAEYRRNSREREQLLLANKPSGSSSEVSSSSLDPLTGRRTTRSNDVVESYDVEDGTTEEIPAVAKEKKAVDYETSKQMEEDERLARQIYEQLYNEDFNEDLIREERDHRIAMRLAHEEELQRRENEERDREIYQQRELEAIRQIQAMEARRHGYEFGDDSAEDLASDDDHFRNNPSNSENNYDAELARQLQLEEDGEQRMFTTPIGSTRRRYDASDPPLPGLQLRFFEDLPFAATPSVRNRGNAGSTSQLHTSIGRRLRSPPDESEIDYPIRRPNILPSLLRSQFETQLGNAMFEPVSYERLLALEDVKRGLSKESLQDMLKVKFKPGHAYFKEDKDCVICQCEFRKDELIMVLPCLHKFHESCATPWLESNKTCPICRNEVE